MEYLFLAILLYFILRTIGNLVRLLGADPTPSRDEQTHESTAGGTEWEGPSPRQQTGTARDEPTFWGEDIEDATWRDLDSGRNPQSATG
ncbi:MAG: hypothetical protein ABEK03_06605 [Candidatus Bipolaricaulia bacterium]